MALITQAQAARLLGITPAAVSIAVKHGRLKVILNENGKKRIEGSTLAEDYRKSTQTKQSNAHRMTSQPEAASSPTRSSSGRMTKTGEYIPDYDESRARTEHLKAELLELDRKQKEGLLVPVADVESTWIEVITMARGKILGIPTKAKQRIPDLDGGAMACLEDIVRETLEDLAGEAEV